MTFHNSHKTCWNCPAAVFKGNVDFRACGQSQHDIKNSLNPDGHIMINCSRRPELGLFEPSISFEQCPEWVESKYGLQLKKMRVMILGIDGYLGWTLALKLIRHGFQVSGIDNYSRRDRIISKGALSVVPIRRMTDRLFAARETFGANINFRRMDIRDRKNLTDFIAEEKPEAIVHYAEIPSAPYSMASVDHAIETQDNNTLGTLGLLWMIKDIVPESSLIKLGTMGEYGAPLTGRPIFEGIFPADAVLQWGGREWSLGGEITPRDPVSFYHASKVHDTFNVYEACKYWWLRSYDIMQGVIYGVHTDELAADERLRTRFDVDEWFGTVINRFVAQAILGIPLTIYGSGEQIKGFIALEEAMECMVRLILSPPEPGQYDVINQVSGLFKIKDIATTVARIGRDEFGLNTRIQRVENPRIETEQHPLEVVASNLPGRFGFEAQNNLEKEIRHMFGLLTQPDKVIRMKQASNVIMPKTRWNGEKKISAILEEYPPGFEIDGSEGHTGVLDTARKGNKRS